VRPPLVVIVFVVVRRGGDGIVLVVVLVVIIALFVVVPLLLLLLLLLAATLRGAFSPRRPLLLGCTCSILFLRLLLTAPDRFVVCEFVCKWES
jgi:hypothetical protein